MVIAVPPAGDGTDAATDGDFGRGRTGVTDGNPDPDTGTSTTCSATPTPPSSGR